MTRTRVWLYLGMSLIGALACWSDGRAQDAPDDRPPAVAGSGGADDVDLDDDTDSEWPREIDADTASIVVYQPQLDAYADGVIEAHSALAITAKDAPEPVFGAVWFRARMQIDREERMCEIFDVDVPRARFPEATPEAEEKLAAIIRSEVPGWVHPISMDRLLPALEALEERSAAEGRLNHEPPRIVVETVPALLVPVDGEAKLVDVPDARIRRVENTPVALLFEPATRTYWIDAGASWMYASSVDGPYRAAPAAPPAIAAVGTSNEEDREDAAAEPAEAGPAPKIVVAHEPTELLVFDGEPVWEPLVGDDLLYAANTASAVFSYRPDKQVYVLLSGRWYRSGSLEGGKWEFVEPDDLPSCFEEIPEDSEMGGVLAHVTGTELANEAILDALIPETKAIRRDTAQCDVDYDGAPRFESVPGTDLRYSVNSASQVLSYLDRYYCCDQGVWFVADAPDGPWAVADAVPDAFREIPPESPVYNVKFVHVYDSTPEVVYVGYTPGYLGWYPWHGVVVWGTGWRYSCWYADHWYPRCSTWGVSVGYNPWSGSWYGGLSLYWGGRWSIGVRMVDGWGWGGSWWGPCGYRRWRRHDGEFHRPVTWRRGFDHPLRGVARRRGPSLYDSRRNRTRNAPDRLATRRVSRWPARLPPPRRDEPKPKPKPTPPPTTTPTPTPPRVDRPRNDVFADRDGRIYRRERDGTWTRREGREWKPVRPGDSTRPGVTEPKTPRPTPPRPTTQPDRERRQERTPVRPAPTRRLSRDAWARDRARVRTPRVRTDRGGGRSRDGGGGGRRGR